MGACLATPHDDAADVFKAPGVDSGPLDSVERRDDPAIGDAVASRLKLRAVAAAKEARGVRFRYNGGVIDGTDAGVVELAISRVKIDDTRAVTAALDANEPLLVTLFHRRGEDRKSASDEDGDEEDAPNARQSNNRERRVHARWVAVGVAECFPDGAKSGALLTHFRERARRELSRHKAPVFALPSDLRFCEGTRDKTLRVVVAKKKKPRQAALFRGRGGRLEFESSRESRIQPLGLTGGVTHKFVRPRRDRPGHVPNDAPHENALEKTPDAVAIAADGSRLGDVFLRRRFVRRSPRVATNAHHARPARRFRDGTFTLRRDFGDRHACVDKPRMETRLERTRENPSGASVVRVGVGGVRGGGDARQTEARCAGDVLGARRARREGIERRRAFGGARRGARDSERARAHVRLGRRARGADARRRVAPPRRGPGLRRRKPL